MHRHPVRTWFVCKCRVAFEEISEFIEHKYHEHFHEFQNVKCITFDERTSDTRPDSELFSVRDTFQIDDLPVIISTSSSPSSINIISSNNDKRILPADPDPEQVFSCKFTNPDQENVVDFKIEEDMIRVNVRPLTRQEFKLRTINFPHKNPFVLLRRLTATEIESANLTLGPDPCQGPGQAKISAAVDIKSARSAHEDILQLGGNCDSDPNPLRAQDSDPDPDFDPHCITDNGSGSESGLDLSIDPKRIKLDRISLCTGADPSVQMPSLSMDASKFSEEILIPQQDQPSSAPAFSFSVDSINDVATQPPKLKNGSNSNSTVPRKYKKCKDGAFKCPHPGCPRVFKRNCDIARHAIRHYGNSSQSSLTYFVFPTQEEDSDPEVSTFPLDEWLRKKTERKPDNFIVLDPDPRTTENLDPISSTNPITCKLCLHKLTSEAELKIHVKHCWLRNKRKHFYCVLCKKTITARSKLKQHILKMHPTEEEKFTRFKFLCEICSRGFFENKVFLTHLDSHKSLKDQNRPFACKLCDSKFYTKTFLSSHMRTHSNLAAFTCPRENCDRKYKALRELRRHERLHHLNPKKFPCSQEGCSAEPFKTLLSKKLHEATHTGQRMLKCHNLNCEKVFLSTKGLKLHMDVHHGGSGSTAVVKFPCNICKKTYSTKNRLKKHLKMHPGKKPLEQIVQPK